MFNLFETKKKKNLQEFIHHLDFMHVFILESLKGEFPEEIVWFLSPTSNKSIKNDIPSVIFAFYSILGGISEKEEKFLKNELNKRNLLDNTIIQEFTNFWLVIEKDVFPTDRKPSVDELIYVAKNIVGKYLCAKVKQRYIDNGQNFSFSYEFEDNVGSLLFVKFNNMLDLIK